MERGMGQLTLLQTLKRFVVGKLNMLDEEGENDVRGTAIARLSELKGLDDLEEELIIEKLENVSHSEIEAFIQDCEEAANLSHLLKGKHHFDSLRLSGGGETQGGVYGSSDAEDAEHLLQGLQPHPNLRKLRIDGYRSVNLASWIEQLHSLQYLEMVYWKEQDLSDDYKGMQLQNLSSLTFLKIDFMPKLASLPVGLRHINTLQHLYSLHCENLTAMPEWIGQESY